MIDRLQLELNDMSGGVYNPGRAARMEFLEENKRHTHGVHKYTLEQFGLNEAMIEERFGHYIERFITA